VLLSAWQVNGRPAFQKMDRDDRWLAWNGDNAWNAQSEGSLGEKKGWIQLLDGVPTPDLTSCVWEAWVDNKWQQQAELTCVATFEHPLPQCVQLVHTSPTLHALQELTHAPTAADDATSSSSAVFTGEAPLGPDSGMDVCREEDGLDPQMRGVVRLHRMQPETDTSISALPSLQLQRPNETCRECLLRVRRWVTNLDILLADVAVKVEQLRWEDLPAVLEYDELFAIAAYTYDFNQQRRTGNLYYELNQGLRQREATARKEALDVWSGYLYFLMAALEKLPSLKMHVYRGHPDKAAVMENYLEGRPVQWGAFSSTSKRACLAASFTDRATGVIFRLKVRTGKDIKDFSFFAAEEEEVLLSPQTKFVVISEPYTVEDGYTYLDLLEQSGTTFLS